jgi:hypothetical protein
VSYAIKNQFFIDTKLAGRTTINQSLILRVFVVDFEDILWHADTADFQTQIFADLKMSNYSELGFNQVK